MLHISELAEHKVESPEDVVKIGDEIEVKILRVDAGDRKIGLSCKRLHAGPEETEAATDEGAAGRPRERELRGGTGTGTAPLFAIPDAAEEKVAAAGPVEPA